MRTKATLIIPHFNFRRKLPLGIGKITGLFLLLLLIGTNLRAQEKVFKAGASTANITPRLGAGIIGNFGTPPPAQHIHDQLHVRSLALDDGATQLVFVVIDNLMASREVLDEAKRLVHERTGLSPSHIMMSATHTHSASSAIGEGDRMGGWNYDKPLDNYQSFLVSRIVDGVQIALNNLEPARIGWGVGAVPQHVFNRRWKMKEPVINPFGEKDLARMNPGIGNPDPLERTYANRILKMDNEWPDKIDIILQAFRIGDLAIAAIPFETFVEIGLDIKKQSPFDSTFTISLANGAYGYLPTPKQHEMGGYETWMGTNRVEKNASQKIVSEMLSLFSQLE